MLPAVPRTWCKLGFVISILSCGKYGPNMRLSRHFIPFDSELAFASTTYDYYDAKIIGSENFIFLTEILIAIKSLKDTVHSR